MTPRPSQVLWGSPVKDFIFFSDFLFLIFSVITVLFAVTNLSRLKNDRCGLFPPFLFKILTHPNSNVVTEGQMLYSYN